MRRRANKPAMAWTVNTGAANAWVGNTGRAIAAATLTQTLLLAIQTAASALGVPAVAGLTILRIVGDFVVQQNNTSAIAAMNWSAGIVLTDDTTGDVSNLLDPTVIADADAKWLWFRHGQCPAQTNASIVASNVRDSPLGAHIDVTVRRKIRPSQTLNLMYKADDASLIFPNLRVLVQRAV